MTADLDPSEEEGRQDEKEALKNVSQIAAKAAPDEGASKDLPGANVEEGEEDDDDETCGFCRFMKAGGCKTEFNAWSECVDTNRGEDKNFTEECKEETVALQRCMEQHRDYYKDFMLDPEPEGQGAEPKDNPSEDANASSGSGKEEPDATPKGDSKEDKEESPAEEKTEGDVVVAEATEMVSAASADVGVDEPLPPTETVLSGLEGEFQPQQEGGSHEEQEGKDEEAGHEADEKAEAKDGEEDQGAEEEGEEEEEQPVIEVQTAAHDPRFPSTNQARHCYTRYNEYHRCVAQKGEDAPECSVFQRAYRSLCPSEWLERWNEQREEGTWPGRY